MKAILIMLTLLLFSVPALEAEETVSGMVYRKDTLPSKQNIHVLEIDPDKLTIVAAHAKDTVRGRESLENIAKRHGALAAINGGFFRRGVDADGLPAGVLKIKGQWYGLAYQKRAAIGWDASGQATLIDRIQTKTTVLLNRKKYFTHTLNQPGIANRTTLYTPAYGEYTDSLEGSINIVIEHHKITAIQTSGKTAIPKDGFVFVMGPQYKMRTQSFKVGDPAKVDIQIHPKNKIEQNAWQHVDNIIGGTPLLVYNGKKIQNYSEERVRSDFLTMPHARTAVGVLKNGNWVLVVVEHNIFNGAEGLTIPELASYMQKLGCKEALNLDGGGSSTLFVKNNVINHPQGDVDEDYGISTVRPISDAILVLPK